MTKEPSRRLPLPAPLRWLDDTPFYQAGLQGYSDAAMRIVARRRGCPYCVTEALVDEVLLSGGKAERKAAPDDEDHPIAGQLMGSAPETMARAARVLVRLGYDVVDVNLACPVKRMGRRRRGGLLLSRPDQARDVLTAVVEAVAGDVPVTVKLRRAFDETAASAAAFRRIVAAAAELGIAAATVHARTVEQKYRGPSRWSFLRELVASAPGLPILGSGDIFRAADIFSMLRETGVRAVAVARGAIGNPWIFRQALALRDGEEPRPPTPAEQRAALEEQWALMRGFHDEASTCRQLRKVGIKFAETWLPDSGAALQFAAIRRPHDWDRTLDSVYGGRAAATR